MRLGIGVDESCLDENLERLVARRAFLVDLDVGADISIATGLLYQSSSRTMAGKDCLGVSTLICMSVEATHFQSVM